MVAAGFAQPYIAYRGVVNAASYAPSGLPSGAIARGSVFTIFGSGLGPNAGQQVSSFPLGTTFGGVSLTVTQGSVSLPAIPLYVSATQINAILPSAAPLGRSVLRVSFGGRQSNPAYFTVADVAPGIYSIYSGAGPGVIQNYIDAGNQPVNSLVTTAAPGQTLTLWGTGLGAVANDTVAPTPGNLPAAVEVWVGNSRASVLYSGRSPCCAGSDQIVFTLPQDVPLGCYVPVTVRANQLASNTVTMAIQTGGRPCSDGHNPLGDASTLPDSGGNVGFSLFNLTRSDTGVHLSALAQFSKQSGPFSFNPIQALPPLNTCTAYFGKANLALKDFLPSLSSTGMALGAAAQYVIDALPLTKQPASGAYYFTQASSTYTTAPSVNPTPSTLSGPAGADVGAINASIAKAPFPFATPLKSLAAISRGSAFTVNWTPDSVSRPFVIVAGGASDHPSNSSSLFLCVAPAQAGRITIPAHILASLPLTRGARDTRAIVAVGNVSSPSALNANNLLRSVSLFTAFDYQFVEVRP